MCEKMLQMVIYENTTRNTEESSVSHHFFLVLTDISIPDTAGSTVKEKYSLKSFLFILFVDEIEFRYGY